ncbi:hypothetical protein M3Y98_00707200 [Aphelenchoides besseyi]|nr:hypothetical protein M3Y98_00707200 [Aphelenchoides besseyi]KAI6210367.1 hypothetical protein M3Y96_00320700 [Aphelenchoides besseyi]
MRLLSVFGVLISSLFVLADYVKNETSVDVHASKRLLQEGPGLSVIKCLCYESNCSGGLQNCPFYSCYQMFSPLGALLHRGCYVAMEQEGWVQRGRILWHFCNTNSIAVYEEDQLRDDICYVTKTDGNGSFIAKGVEKFDGFMALSWFGGVGDKVYFYVRHNCNRDYLVCSKIELGDTIWSHSPKTVVAPTVLPAIELARTDLKECLERVVADMEQEYTGPECVN